MEVYSEISKYGRKGGRGVWLGGVGPSTQLSHSGGRVPGAKLHCLCDRRWRKRSTGKNDADSIIADKNIGNKNAADEITTDKNA